MSKNWVYLYKPKEHNVVCYRIEDPSVWVGNPLAAINPDVTDLKKIKRHHLKVADHTLQVCNTEEKEAADAFHNALGKTSLISTVIQEVEKEVIKEIPVEIKVDRVVTKYKLPTWGYYTHAGLALAIVYLLWR